MYLDLFVKSGYQEKYTTNNTHKTKFCEDYGLKFKNGVIIGDGCSSALDTDIGARVLCQSAKIKLLTMDINWNNIKERDNFNFEVLRYARYIVNENLLLHDSSLNSTLTFLHEDKNKIYVNQYNDGFVIAKFKDNDFVIRRAYYKINAPYYLLNRYHDTIYEESEYRKVFPDNRYVIETIIMDKNFNIKDRSEMDFDIRESLFLTFYKNRILREDNVDYILIMSDGFESFKKRGENKFIDYIDVLKDFLDFKNMNGEFIQRRAKHFFKKYESENIIHLDDIVIGGVVLNENN